MNKKDFENLKKQMDANNKYLEIFHKSQSKFQEQIIKMLTDIKKKEKKS